MLSARIASLVAFAFAAARGASGAEFHVDPVHGSPAGDGSAAAPWRTLQEVVEAGLIETRDWESHPYQPGLELVTVNAGAPVGAGDTIRLYDGYHGELLLRGAYNVDPITIAPAPGHAPRLGRVRVEAAQHWVLSGLSVSPSHAQPPLSAGTIVTIDDHNWFGPVWDVTFEDGDVFTVDDASGWSADDWVNAASSGIGVGGERIAILDTRVRNVRFGISVGGLDARIAFNEIDGFSADGLRGLGDGGRFEYNLVRNAYVDGPTDPNHDDGFQSWSVGPGGVGTGEVRDVVLRGNVFVNHVDPGHPLRATLQGIGCFDGRFVDWIVENNVVVTDHWHGISLYGATGGRIVNNTVIDLDPGGPGPPWIMLNEHDGVPSQNVVVRNNLATDLAIAGSGIVADHNLEVTNPAALFVAPPFDLHLRADAAIALDAGAAALAPPRDADRVARPQGAAIDLGAYERCPFCLFSDGFERGDLDAWSPASPRAL